MFDYQLINLNIYIIKQIFHITFFYKKAQNNRKLLI